MNEAVTAASASPVILIFLAIFFGLGWAGALWYTRNRDKAEAFKALLKNKAKLAEAFAKSAGDEAEEALKEARRKLGI